MIPALMEDMLIGEVAEASATSECGDHLVQMYHSKFILLDREIHSIQQASGYLRLGEWTPVVATCGDTSCVRPDHLADAHTAKDEEDLQLVANHAVSLADLYRKGRNRGLLTPRTDYGG